MVVVSVFENLMTPAGLAKAKVEHLAKEKGKRSIRTDACKIIT
jgi:hypothetical protein